MVLIKGHIYTVLVFLSTLPICTDSRILDWHGVNLAGMDFGLNVTTAWLQPRAKPVYPSIAEVDQWIALNATLFRFPVLWNYLQPSFEETISSSNTTFNHLNELVSHVTDNGNNHSAYAILDVHSFARYNGSIVGHNDWKPYDWDLMDLWKQLAKIYQNNSQVMFGLMNEPHDLNISQWASTMQNVICSIRNITDTQWILIEGTDWANLSTWPSNSSPAFASVSDPAGKMLIDVHQYFDHRGGASGECADFNTLYMDSFKNFTKTLRSMDLQAILTEFGGHNTTHCRDSMNDMLAFMENRADVFRGWTAWGAGNGLRGEVLFLDPTNAYSEQLSVDIPRDVLMNHMHSGSQSSSVLSLCAPTPHAVSIVCLTSLVVIISCGYVYLF